MIIKILTIKRGHEMRCKLTFLISMLLFYLILFVLTGCGPLQETSDEPVAKESNEEELLEGTANGNNDITIAAGKPVEIYFPLAAGLAYVIERRIENITVIAETTGASVENCRLVGSGKSEMGMAIANVAWEAYAGEESFEDDGKLPVRTLFSMYPAQQHLLTHEDSDIESVEDLAGKTVSVDAPGSACEDTSYIILETAGIMDEVDTVNYSHPEASEALIEGTVDAVFYNFASPAVVVEDIITASDVRFVPIGDGLIDTIIEGYPYFSPGVIPEGHYGLEEDVPALSVVHLMLVHEDMNEHLAYALVEAVFDKDSLEELIGIHPIARNFQVTTASEAPVPFHPGAERFFEKQ